MSEGSWFHANRSTVKRSEGRSAVATAAYCSGTAIYDETERTTHDYSRKRGVVESFVTTPEGKPGLEWAHDIAALSNAMEAHEKRKDSQVGHQWRIALPASDLDGEQRSALTHEMAQTLSNLYGVAVIAGIHLPDEHGDQRNHHAHLLFTTRQVEEDGLGAKVTSITSPSTSAQEVNRFREIVAELTNQALADAGSETRVSHLSFEARGIKKEATTHLGPAASALERDGIGSDRGDINKAIIEDRVAEQVQLSAAIAQQFEGPPQEMSLETERELARRFGDEWLDVKTDSIAAPLEDAEGAWQPENPASDVHEAMQPELARVTTTGTTHSSSALHRWVQARTKAFFEFLRDESGAPAPSPDHAPEQTPTADADTQLEPDEGRNWVSRVWDAGRNALHGWQHRVDKETAELGSFVSRLGKGPPEEHGGDEPRPGGNVEPPEPDSDRPQEAWSGTMSAFGTLSADLDVSTPEPTGHRLSAFDAVMMNRAESPPTPSSAEEPSVSPSPAAELSAHLPEL